MITFIQFVLAFTLARWIDEHLLRPLGRVVWEKFGLWMLMIAGFKQRVKETVHGDD